MTCLLCCPASDTRSVVTFKLPPRCRPRDEQKCHRVMTNKQCLYPILIPLFIRQKSSKVHLHWKEMRARKPQAHTRNCRCDASKYDIVPQIKVNPSKATRFRFFPPLAFCEQSLSLTHTQAQRPFVVWAACTHQILPPLPFPPPLSASVYHRADRQRWVWIAPWAVEVCSSV